MAESGGGRALRTWVKHQRGRYVAGPFRDRKIQNWRNFKYASRQRGRILITMEQNQFYFPTELVIDTDPKTWDTLRKKFPKGAQYLKFWHKERGQKEKAHVFIAGAPPESFGRIDVKVVYHSKFQDCLKAVKGVAGHEPEFPTDRSVKKHSSNIDELQFHSRNKADDHGEKKTVSYASVRDLARFWHARKAMVTWSPGNDIVRADLPDGKDDLDFQFQPPEPSGEPGYKPYREWIDPKDWPPESEKEQDYD